MASQNLSRDLLHPDLFLALGNLLCMATLSIPRQLGLYLKKEADAVFLLQEIHLADATLVRTQWIILSLGHRLANWHSWNFGTLG